MASNEIYYEEELESYQDLFNPRQRRNPRPAPSPAKPDLEVIEELVEDAEGLEAGFDPTYQPSRYEAGWLLSSLRSFYDRALITDVLARVKGGKEASVYCCAAHPSTGVSLLAAKVYRPRKFRTMRNDFVYRQGREILTAGGQVVKKTDHRIMRAIGKKTPFGIQVQHTSWLMHEYTTMEELYELGATVPRPIAASENAILMTYYGDAYLAAPTLNEIRLPAEEAGPLFQAVLDDVERMLALGLIHGDLSPYNVLYWAGETILIDFPQVTYAEENPDAYALLQRDITRIGEYFMRQGVENDPQAITDGLWAQYVMNYLTVPAP